MYRNVRLRYEIGTAANACNNSVQDPPIISIDGAAIHQIAN